jgi:hypothetical protein
MLLLLVLVGGVLRALRLTWQPLWWDEGYSVFFATEPLLTMLQLTAQDIHPPLYYALLRGWLLLCGDASPLALRTFSLAVGVLTIPAFWWLARSLFPNRAGLVLLATLLLVLNPMHIFYSQEIRMYGLEMLLGILSTGFFWRMMAADNRRQTTDDRRRPDERIRNPEHAVRNTPFAIRHSRSAIRSSQIGYFLSTTALLYTEYYAVLLPLAHFLWAAWHFRQDRAPLWRLVRVNLLVALSYLPWLFYAVPELVHYIPHKVIADADEPLGLANYLWRHLLAFSAGHVRSQEAWLYWAQVGGVVAVAIIGIGYWIVNWRRGRTKPSSLETEPKTRFRETNPPTPISLLLLAILLPFTIGFLLNLNLPFFPEGGERVLLFVLPYFLILLAAGIDTLLRRQTRWSVAGAGVAIAGLVLAAQAGIAAFYTVPRYVEGDYRGLIRQTVQQGQDEDTVFAIFPWQVGYWRAYAPLWGRGEHAGPWPILSPSPAWDDDVAATLHAALARGKLWFPAHLSLGAILEGDVEAYLAERALNFENRWYNSETRLSGWTNPAQSAANATENELDFGPVRLQMSGVAARRVASANQILPVMLAWQVEEPEALPLNVSLRLLDTGGRVWANRDYTLEDAGDFSTWQGQQLGVLVPPGIPPGSYKLAVGVGPVVEDPWLFPVTTAAGTTDLAPLANIQVVLPDRKLSPLRLPIQQPLATPVDREGIEFLGFSGYDPDMPTLAGAELALSLFVRNQTTHPAPQQIYISLLNGSGVGVAGWEGWPLPAYPLDAWTVDALVRIPVNFYLPAALPPGDYTLIAGLIDPANGAKSKWVELGKLPVMQREIRFDAPTPQHVLDPPAQVGIHARLIGYDLEQGENRLALVLYWEVLQTLLPPHQVFVHLTGPDGQILDQDDGMPGRRAIAAPSGTWLPGEIIVDPHRLTLPPALPAGTTINVGLYLPATGARLQVFLGSEPKGDAISLPIRPE